MHALVKVSPSNFYWFLSTIYASVVFDERLKLWHNLKSVADSMNLPWVVMRDFNDVINQQEKKGGRLIDLNRVTKFKEMLDYYSLTDLGYSGSYFHLG